MKSLLDKLMGGTESEAKAAAKQTAAVKTVKRPHPETPKHQTKSASQNSKLPAKPTLTKEFIEQRRSDNGSVPVRPNGGRARVASKETVDILLDFKGQILTAPGGPAAITEMQAQFVALLDDRSLIVSRSHAMSHEVSSVRTLLRHKGLGWQVEYHVDLDIVRRLYENHERNAPAKVSNDSVQMQREFLQLISKAATMRASDIHVVVHRYVAVVEVRVDSMVTKLQDLTSSVALELCQAAFAMSDVSDPTYMPMEQQGARVTSQSLKGLKFPEGVQSIRLQFSPLPNGGRYMVARLLYEQKVGSDADVDQLGYAPLQIEQIKTMRRKPFGINIVSGPTGSGKSTTLQRGLVAVMRERPGINVVTIEDPPEYIIAGAKQIPVANASTAEERKEKFRQAITGALRLDPDVIMIGEIRDGASAHLGFEAAQTGHGVWTTLHSNDAISNLDRLRDMGVEVYNLADATLITGLIGQRLVRRTRQETSVSFEEGVASGYITESCERAIRSLAGPYLNKIRFAGTPVLTDLTKFSGRTVVAETIIPDQPFLDLFREGRKSEATAYWLEHLNGVTMLEHAFTKMCAGEIDPREIEDKIGLIETLDPNRIGPVFSRIG